VREGGLVQIALFAALVAALGLLPPLPFLFGVPLTAQSLGVMLTGVLLGPRRAFLALALFLFAVALGAPLLSGGRGGLGVFAGPTAGFALGFAPAAAATGYLMQALHRLPVFSAALLASLGGGVLVLYACGIPGLHWTTGMEWAAASRAVLVFVPGDLLKAVLTAFIARGLARGMNRPEGNPHPDRLPPAP